VDADIELVTAADLGETLGLMRLYCDFYEVAPSDADLCNLFESLLEDPSQGIQLIARDGDGAAIGFATIYWTWQTLSAARCAVMNDLYVIEEARGEGIADRLIESCAELCRSNGVSSLVWQTALDNSRAQAVYDRVGAQRSTWLDYSLDLGE
jgi:GNAT superfamily N-acetyltransferase